MSDESHIELPAPTPWPLVTAFGLALIFAGLVTHWLVSTAGLVVILHAAVGWFRDIYPHEKHEASALLPASDHMPEPLPRTVEHLHLGEEGHRVHYPLQVHPYSSGIKGGIVGGAVMAILALIYGWGMQHSIWWPVNLLSAAVMPSLSSANEATLHNFSLSGLLVGIVVHAILSILVGLLYAAALPMFPKFAWLWAGILSPLIWSGLFYATGQFINPALARYVDWPWFIVCQLGFGMVGGFVVAHSQKINTLQSFPISVRAGVDSMRRNSGGENK